MSKYYNSSEKTRLTCRFFTTYYRWSYTIRIRISLYLCDVWLSNRNWPIGLKEIPVIFRVLLRTRAYELLLMSRSFPSPQCFRTFLATCASTTNFSTLFLVWNGLPKPRGHARGNSGHNDAHAGGEASEVERVYDRECFVQSGQSTASESAGESLPSTSGPSEGIYLYRGYAHGVVGIA